MMEKDKAIKSMIKLPVRQLVELIMRCGDIDSRFVARDIMAEGARAHRLLQKKSGDVYDDYRSEVWLSAGYQWRGMDYTLEGRADGIFKLDGGYVIEEIKTTLLPMNLIDEDFSSAHWAQAKCYAGIFAAQNNLPQVSVQLTYFHLETSESKKYLRSFEAGELDRFINSLVESYSVWTVFSGEWQESRDLSIKGLQFPFPDYRQGQRELAVNTYKTIVGGRKLFVQAPTGIGKTISVLFPSIKAMGEGKTSKIFYLTAKTTTRQVAEETFSRMRQGGLRIKTLTLTAKEKICFCVKPVCNPEHCEYAKGHYDRINEAVLETIAGYDDLSRTVVESTARKHKVCPFELSLDLSLWADCVICDYNYVFDPRVYLRRFFSEHQGDYVFLIDEAHNLVDRSRDMFSAKLHKNHFYQIKKAYKGHDKALDRLLNQINRAMVHWRKQCADEGYQVTADLPQEFLKLIHKYAAVCESMLKENSQLSEDSAFMQLYFAALDFLSIADLYDERYVTFVETQGDEVICKLFCLDPSHLLKEALHRGRSAVMFSATLSPPGYFLDLLGGGKEDKILSLDSPFDILSLCVLTADNISTKYQAREHTKVRIAQLIWSFVSRKTGNYIVYFPSYQYMHSVFAEFSSTFPDLTAIEQTGVMSEEQREDFLASFQENPAKTYIAFCVLGGIFSEGIDLPGTRLIGAVVVSVGLPQLSIQQNIIRDYFNGKNGRGYEYAYMYPGMNKVLQAAGRVIRSEQDTGALLLIDERYGHKNYIQLFPRHWQPLRKIRDREILEHILASFWGQDVI